MQCCLNSRLPAQILQKADQIKFQYRDHNSIPDYLEYKKPIIIDCYDTEINWNQMLVYQKLCRNGFYLCLSKIEDAKNANDLKIDWYWGYSVSTFYEAKGLITLGSKYLKLGAPLFFNLEYFKTLCPKVKIRHTPNVAYSDGLPRPNGVSGTWIRPEDLYLYEDYIDIIEFEDCNRDKESTLYNIYMVQKNWSTDLNLIITNLNHMAINRLIQSDMTKSRLNCRQRCEEGNRCQVCYRTLKIANPELIESYVDSQKDKTHI